MTFAQPFSDYEILERIGGGAMGTVFKARHRRLGRIVALKVLKPSLSRDQRYVERLRREARIVASLAHPHIVTGYDLGEESGYHYFVMEFVDGRTLRALLAEWGMFAEEHVRKVARQVAQALDHAWQRGVIHRDVKPGNLLVDGRGDVKLSDLGLAKGPTDATLTRDGATLGTPYYIAPEQARDPSAADVRSDLYSLGATLYHMATGVPPFQGATLAEVLTHVLNEPPVAPQAINPALSEGMSLVIRKLLAKDPALRYPTPGALLDDLDRLDRALPPQIHAGQLARAEGERPRRGGRAALAALAAAALAGAWWLGQAFVAGDPAAAAAAAYLQQLDRDLAAAPTPAARLAAVQRAASAPPGAADGLAERRRAAEQALAATVEAAAAAFAGEGLAGLAGWIDDPAVWPGREQVLRLRLRAHLQAAGGVDGDAPMVRTAAVAAAEQAIDARLAARDAALLQRCDAWLADDFAAAVADACARDDFLAAEAVGRTALVRFLDGERQPRAELVAAPTLAAVRERVLAAQQAAERDVIAPAEQALAAAVRDEAGTAADRLERALADGVGARGVADELARLRADMVQRWPPHGAFRPARSPWPEVEARLAAVASAAALAGAAEQAARLAARAELVWRALCTLGAGPALALLGETAPDGAAAAAEWQQHRRAVLAAAAVERALAAAIAAAGGSVEAVERADGAAAVLGVGADGRFAVRGADGKARPAALGALRLAAVFRRLPQAFVGTPERDLGGCVWLLVAEELDELAARAPALAPVDHAFLLDVVAPIAARVRGAPPPTLGRLEAFALLQERLAAAGADGPLDDVERALAQCATAVPDGARSDAEEALVRAARERIQGESRRRSRMRELAAAAPPGALVDVQGDGARLQARVQVEPRVLQQDAPAAWQLRDDGLAVAAPADARAAAANRLHLATGFDPATSAIAVAVDVVVPAADAATRAYVLGLRGVHVVVCLDQSDGLHAAVVRGDPARAEALGEAIGRAMRGVLAADKRFVTPGARHRWTLRLVPNAARTTAVVDLRCDDVPVLAGERRPIDPAAVPEFELTALHALAVARIAFADGV